MAGSISPLVCHMHIACTLFGLLSLVPSTRAAGKEKQHADQSDFKACRNGGDLRANCHQVLSFFESQQSRGVGMCVDRWASSNCSTWGVGGGWLIWRKGVGRTPWRSYYIVSRLVLVLARYYVHHLSYASILFRGSIQRLCIGWWQWWHVHCSLRLARSEWVKGQQIWSRQLLTPSGASPINF